MNADDFWKTGMEKAPLSKAPIGRVFVSIEGETSRVGELTGFVHVADGRYLTVQEALNRLDIAASGYQRQRPWPLVLDVCEATYFDWRDFAREFIANVKDAHRPVLETRGERWLDQPDSLVYLNLTLGTTSADWFTHLRPPFDTVKYLLHDPADIATGIWALEPYLKQGGIGYLLPRVPLAELPEYIERFKRCAVPNVRLMLIEHEVIGID